MYRDMSEMMRDEGGLIAPMFNDFIDGVGEHPGLGGQSRRRTHEWRRAASLLAQRLIEHKDQACRPGGGASHHAKDNEMRLRNKLLLIILDGQPWRNARRLMGNLEGWVEAGDARVWKMRSVLPSTSASCYASIHTGVPPRIHGVLSNETLFRVEQPDIFSEVTKAGGKTGAVTHSFWSIFFQRAPFDIVRDIEYDDAEGPIHHGRFHTMAGYNHQNQMTPSDLDLFATLTMLTERYTLDYGILHTCTLDSMGHRYGHDCSQMDHACFTIDAPACGVPAPLAQEWLRDHRNGRPRADRPGTPRRSRRRNAGLYILLVRRR